MAGRIPEDIIETIRERSSIVEVVSAHVALKKAGRGYSGLCPFHAEKTPSFTVNEDRGLYHCFGCGEGGTVFTFLMKMEGLDFRGAVEQLAQRAGIRLPEESSGPAGDDRQRLFQLNDAAQRRYVAALRGAEGDEARAYLAGRGVSDEVVERYGLGLCPVGGSSFLRALGGRREAVDAALSIGLLGRRDDGRVYERQWGRITFPIRDASGRIVGFGGRAPGERQPKYLNSPESPLFHKGSVLYGLHEARNAIRDADRVVLVEGYMDVLSLVQYGVTNVVANLGTALTEGQLRLARRLSSNVVVFFDGDRAGHAAALRAFELCATADVWVYGAFLQDGDDPDSFVRTRGVDATRALLDGAVALEDFFFRTIHPGPAATLPQREAAARRAGEILNRVTDPVRFTLLARRAAEELNVDEGLFREMRTVAARRPQLRMAPQQRDVPVEPAVPSEPAMTVEEKGLLEAMVLDRGACGIVLDDEVIERLLSPRAAALARAVLDAWDDQGSAAGMIDRFPAELGARISAGLMGEGPLAEADKTRIARDCIEKLEERRIEARIRALRREQERAHREGDTDAEQERLREIDALRRTRRASGQREKLGGEDVA